MITQMTELEIEQEGDRITELIKAALKEALPTDMLPAKVDERAKIISALVGMTRTSVAGAVIYAATLARIVGLDVAKIHELVDTIDKIVEESTLTPIAQENYAKANKAYYEQKAVEFDELLSKLPSGKVH